MEALAHDVMAIRAMELMNQMGNDAIRFENFTYRLAEMTTEANESLGLKRYNGGHWSLEKLELPDQKYYFWFKLQTPDKFQFVGIGNGSCDVIDAELMSMVLVLMVTSDLCGNYFLRANEAEAANAEASRVQHLQDRNEFFHDMHHALKDHFYSLMESDPKRAAMFFRLID